MQHLLQIDLMFIEPSAKYIMQITVVAGYQAAYEVPHAR